MKCSNPENMLEQDQQSPSILPKKKKRILEERLKEILQGSVDSETTVDRTQWVYCMQK